MCLNSILELQGNNSQILIRLASAEQNTIMEVGSGERDTVKIEQLQSAIDSSPDIADKLTALIKGKIDNA